MNREKQYNLTFTISACYYSLYAICMKLGIKCEIHSCTIEFMKKLLDDFYSKDDIKTIKKAFDTRNIAQYYVDKIIPKEDVDFIISKAPLFFTKSKEILAKINEEKIGVIRKKIEEF